MATVTAQDLRRILIQCAGEGEVDLGDDFADRTFEELGYDSLAFMETVAIIEREFGTRVGEADITTVTTPSALLDHVNQSMANMA